MAETKKKPPAKKKAPKKKTASKTTAAKKPVSTKTPVLKSTARKTRSSAASAEKNINPLSILIIMALVVVILLLVNRFYSVKAPAVKTEKNTAQKIVNNKGGTDAVAMKSDSVALEKDRNEDRSYRQKENPPELKEVKIYFVKLNEKTEKMYLSTVKRKIKDKNYLNETLSELIRGPSRAEQRAGYLSAVPPGLRVRSARVRKRTAEVDFTGEIEVGAAGSILISRLDQIVYTVTQFDGIDSLVIRVNGRRKSSLGADGLSISGPLHRRE